MTDRSLTRDDLIAGCRLAIQARSAPVEMAGLTLGYSQQEWFRDDPERGTACCVHGFACLAAGWEPESIKGPRAEDYSDLSNYESLKVRCILSSAGDKQAPERLLRYLGETP